MRKIFWLIYALFSSHCPFGELNLVIFECFNGRKLLIFRSFSHFISVFLWSSLRSPKKLPTLNFFLLDVGFSHWFFTCLDTQNLQSKYKGNMAYLRKVLSRFWFKLLLCYSHPLSSVQSQPWSTHTAPFNSSFSKDFPATDAEQSNTTSLLQGDTNSYEHISSIFSKSVW